ncbi:MAG: methyltransferase [Candidatus Palauibacterales bacterium]|jgi:protein-S-isoprenylcysteine O-methyltransferase Ste14|nr:methyltransferase [Candidatus Palauibacterales bacterium]MDP2483611.1 methyltransferase [Candidatus Palauibacterales bacterium]
MKSIFVVLRALTYASIFVGLVLVFVPARLISWSGIARPESIGAVGMVGAAAVIGGAALALWCVLTFAFVGRGTPAPFDPPRRLVVRGPYRFVRNPMYIGATLALAGASLFYRSPPLLAYTLLFVAVTHVFVVAYEEPALTRMFGADYELYRRRVRRWRPWGRGPDAGANGSSDA